MIWESFFHHFGIILAQSSEDRLVHSSSLSARIDMMQLFGRRHADLISSMSNFTFPVFLMTRQRLRRHLQLAPLLLRAHTKQEAIRTALQTSYLTLPEQTGRASGYFEHASQQHPPSCRLCVSDETVQVFSHALISHGSPWHACHFHSEDSETGNELP